MHMIIITHAQAMILKNARNRKHFKRAGQKLDKSTQRHNIFYKNSKTTLLWGFASPGVIYVLGLALSGLLLLFLTFEAMQASSLASYGVPMMKEHDGDRIVIMSVARVSAKAIICWITFFVVFLGVSDLTSE